MLPELACTQHNLQHSGFVGLLVAFPQALGVLPSTRGGNIDIGKCLRSVAHALLPPMTAKCGRFRIPPEMRPMASGADRAGAYGPLEHDAEIWANGNGGTGSWIYLGGKGDSGPSSLDAASVQLTP